MTELSLAELAEGSGIDIEAAGRLVDAGVIAPSASGRFQASDTARVRLVTALEETGLSLDALREALGSGRLSLGYVDQLMPQPVRLVSPPEELSEVIGNWEPEVEPILGTHRRPEDPIREDDLALFRLFERAASVSIPPDRVIGILRAMAQVASRLVDMQREFVDDVLLAPAIAETGSPMAALEATAATRYEYRRMGRELILLLMDRFIDDAIFANLVHLTEMALEESGVARGKGDDAVVFVDISRYTELSEEHGDLIAAQQATLLTAFMQELAKRHRSRLVKSLGDGAMMHAPDPESGLVLALEAVEGAEGRGLWPLHASVNVGTMVQRDGDLFGSAVNVAARLAAEASPGEVVVTAAVADQVDDGIVEFVPLGEVILRNVTEPVALFRARPV